MLLYDPELVLPLLEPLDELEELEEPELPLELLDELEELDGFELLLDEEPAGVKVVEEELPPLEPELPPEWLLLVEPDEALPPFPEDENAVTHAAPRHVRPALQG